MIALKHFKRQGVDAILHCGDVTSKGDSPLEFLTYRGWCLHTIVRLLNCSTVKLANLLFGLFAITFASHRFDILVECCQEWLIMPFNSNFE